MTPTFIYYYFPGIFARFLSVLVDKLVSVIPEIIFHYIVALFLRFILSCGLLDAKTDSADVCVSVSK